MFCYYNKLLPNHFGDYFIPISSIHSLSTRLFQSAQFIPTPQDNQPLTICFYIESTLPQENVPLHLLAKKWGLQYQTILRFQPLLLLNRNLRNTSYMKKIHNYELQQHFTYPEQNTVSCSIV